MVSQLSITCSLIDKSWSNVDRCIVIHVLSGLNAWECFDIPGDWLSEADFNVGPEGSTQPCSWEPEAHTYSKCGWTSAETQCNSVLL